MKPTGAAFPAHIVVMGVAGSGKSAVGQALARRTGRVFADADQFHTDASRLSMASGAPLSDADRAPWLVALKEWMSEQARAGRSTVLACSALRRSYRATLSSCSGGVFFVHLDVRPELLAERLRDREAHFMPASLLASQLATLEVPGQDEPALVLDGSQPVDVTVQRVRACLATMGSSQR